MRTIVDDYGRALEIPANINRVLCCGPIECLLVYMLAPEKLGGWTYAPTGSYINQTYADLPDVGGWYGKVTGNYETFLAMQPDIMLTSDRDTIDERQENFGSVPVVYIDVWDNFDTVPDSVEFMGEIITAREKARTFIDYYNKAANYVSSVLSNIPEEERVRVYYAEWSDGLSTDPEGSQHSELIKFCGGINVADLEPGTDYGMVSISMEQILEWNPEVIIVGRGTVDDTYTTIMSSGEWAAVQAVKNSRVYVRPDDPYSWFDGPPGMNEIVGIYWMIKKLYPDQTADLDLKSKVMEFYSDFYHYDLTDGEYETLIGSSVAAV
jgi:iron complex transport system substrate-binding protein